jgi:hypothetical protein
MLFIYCLQAIGGYVEIDAHELLAQQVEAKERAEAAAAQAAQCLVSVDLAGDARLAAVRHDERPELVLSHPPKVSETATLFNWLL